MTPIIHIPSKATLRKYGLDSRAWLDLLESQGGVCAICKKVPQTGRFRTDHFHIKGWKKMKPEKRRLYVRGLTCWWCNKSYLGRGITIEKALNMAAYLQAFAVRMVPVVLLALGACVVETPAPQLKADVRIVRAPGCDKGNTCEECDCPPGTRGCGADPDDADAGWCFADSERAEDFRVLKAVRQALAEERAKDAGK